MSSIKQLHYDAFISYRHNEFDSFIAENLHKKLENFKLPKSVYSKIGSGKRKIERVFRDVDELPLTDNLSDPISLALSNSDFLICICTPRYLESKWCMKEIEVFLKTHTRDHILVVLAEGEPEDSFPKILTYEEVKTTNAQGENVIIKREMEPLAADTRADNRKDILKAMDIAVIKLCAAIFGLNFDDLRQRHRAQKIRRLSMIFGSIGAFLFVFAIFATVMLVKISKQNRQLQYDLAATMANVSDNLMEDGRPKDAAYAVRGALPDSDDAFYNENALRELYYDMGVYKASSAYTPVCIYDTDVWVRNFDLLIDGSAILLDQGSAAYVYDTENGNVTSKILYNSPNSMGAVLCQGGVIWSSNTGCSFYSLGSQKSEDLELSESAVFFHNDDGSLVIINDGDKIYGMDGNGEFIYTIDIGSVFDFESPVCTYVSFVEDEIMCLFTGYDAWGYIIADSGDGQIHGSFEESTQIYYDPLAEYSNDIVYSAIYTPLEEGDITRISAADAVTGDKVWEISLDDLETENGKMLIDKQYLYVCGKSEIAVIDIILGELITRYSYNEYIIESWLEDDILYLISDKGKVYECTALYGQVEATDDFFDKAPGNDITYAKYVNGDLYCLFKNAGYVTRYSNDISPLATAVTGEYEKTSVTTYLPEEIFGNEEIYDFSIELVDGTVFYSDDKKYSFGLFTDHTAKIFNAETGDLIISFETTDMQFDDFRYSKLTGSYILSGEESYIFDKDMRIVCITDRIICEEGDSFIMENSDIGKIRIPYVDYETLCKMADDYLMDYEPPYTVRQKYGLNLS